MEPYYERAGVRIFHGDCFDVLPSLTGLGAVAAKVGLAQSKPAPRRVWVGTTSADLASQDVRLTKPELADAPAFTVNGYPATITTGSPGTLQITSFRVYNPNEYPVTLDLKALDPKLALIYPLKAS